MKRILSIILSLVMIASLCIPASAGTRKPENGYTYVLVHGMGGWGPDCSINKISPYWGSITGSLSEYLNKQGYSVTEASVGPFSSAWDRACELYAQLTGTTVDYGAAHSEKYHHARYGKTYSTPIVNDWSHINKINLVGHSFGGETVRLLASLMTYGNAEEIKAGGKISPLFEGGNESWINSVVTLDSPHNGTTLYNIVNSTPFFVQTLLLTVKVVGDLTMNTAVNNFYDVGLSQFKKEIFVKSADQVGYDLSPEGAAELNKIIKTSDNIYYFSYASVTTEKNKTGCLVPNKDTFFVLKPTSLLMGIYKSDTFVPENDGLVNLNSALHPFNEPFVTFDNNNINPGVWNVMPVLRGHHGTIIGMDGNTEEIHEFYINLFNMINTL